MFPLHFTRWCKGNTGVFEALIQGSNPCRVAICDVGYSRLTEENLSKRTSAGGHGVLLIPINAGERHAALFSVSPPIAVALGHLFQYRTALNEISASVNAEDRRAHPYESRYATGQIRHGVAARAAAYLQSDLHGLWSYPGVFHLD